jgi:hypothetical protein
MSSFLVQPNSKRTDVPPNRLESAARAALEQRAGRTLIDAEWVRGRAKFMEFGDILREWDRKTTASRRGNVDVLCQPEP